MLEHEVLCSGKGLSFSFTSPTCGLQTCHEKKSSSVEEVSCACMANASVSPFFPHTKLTRCGVAIFIQLKAQTNVSCLLIGFTCAEVKPHYATL